VCSSRAEVRAESTSGLETASGAQVLRGPSAISWNVAKGGRMEREAVQDLPEASADPGVQSGETFSAVSRAREAINLRLLLELRRRLKAAAERELAIGADRMRRFRADLRRGEVELRLFGRALHTRGEQLGRVLARVQNTQARTAQTCDRLSSLEQEHEDLSRQLGAAAEEAAGLQRSVRSTRQVRSGTLDSLVLATEALSNDLAYAVRDQASLRARGRDLMEEGEALAARAGALHTCFSSLALAVGTLSDEMEAALDGLPARRRALPAKLNHGENKEAQGAS